MKMVGMAPGRKLTPFRILCLKYSLPKWSLHRWELALANHWLRVRCTCFSHLRKSSGSLGNVCSDTLSAHVFPQPYATHWTGIVSELLAGSGMDEWESCNWMNQ